MSTISTSGILLRPIEYGDHDLIVTLLTLDYGKAPMMAKYARKSRKRFTGTLELFSELTLVATLPKKGGLPVIKEASLKQAYASYWTELVFAWLEEGKVQAKIYQLLRYSLAALDAGEHPGVTSIIFQLYFLKFSGLSPNLKQCMRC